MNGSNICVSVEFLAGTSIEAAVEEAVEKCKLWQVAYVKFSFNGVNMSVKTNTNVDLAVVKWNEAMKSKDEHKFVVG